VNALWEQILRTLRRNPIAVAGLTAFVVLGAANYFLWRWQLGLRAVHERVHTSGENMLLSLAGHSRLQTQLAAAQEALAIIDKNLAVETDLAGNLDYFYQMEKAARVHLDNLNQLSSQPAPPDSPYKAVPFFMQVTGTYRQIMNFIHAIESGARIAKIKTYSVTRGPGGGAAIGRDPGARPAAAEDNVALNLTVLMLARP
jgi:Tfp pilus assembly protein PilO